MFRSEDPPAPADIAAATPPVSDKPTTAMLKADIDSGRTGDKVDHYDVGLSPLGTDDEVAGNAPSPERIALARETEAASERVRRSVDPHGRGARGVPYLFVGFVALVPVIVGLALWLVK